VSSYLQIQYAEDRVPRTGFPSRLTEWLAVKFGILRGDELLDVGCGRGDFLRAWQGNCRAWGLDQDPQAEDIDRVDLMSGRWPWPDTGVDVVFSKSVIEHLPDPGRFLKETYRVLRPGGRIIVMTPDWRTYMRTFYDDYTHVRPYDRVSLADLLTAAGFWCVEVERIYQYPPMWDWPALRPLAWLWRQLAPVELSLWLSSCTGCGFFRWASQLTLLGSGVKPL
jgi:SAM-dependent methyltransferase